MGKKESIQYTMIAKALHNITNDNTKRAYKKDIRDFAQWCRSIGIKTVDDIYRAFIPTNPDQLDRLSLERGFRTKEDLQQYSARRVIQIYRDEVVIKKTSSPSTEHRKIAAICKGLSIVRPRGHEDPGWEDRVITTKRTADKIVRGRKVEKNQQGKREADQERYSRLVRLQQAVGIRRDELRRLRGRDLIEDESGYLCVRVVRGKGGKTQLQRVLPDDVETVREVFSEITPDQRVFSQQEMANKINLHHYRAEQAQKAYGYYKSILKTDEDRQKLVTELQKRFQAMREDGHGRSRFDAELQKALEKPTYKLRGANRQKALQLGLPVVYDRLAVLAVSVFHLSHWRTSVAVTNYLIQ